MNYTKSIKLLVILLVKIRISLRFNLVISVTRSLSENGSTAEENLDLAIFRAFIS
jgi:hypothetical protein